MANAPSITASVSALPGIDSFPFFVAVRESPTLMAALEIGHLTGISLLIGTVIAFDLRILGLNRRLSVSVLARHLLPLGVGSLMLIVPTGLTMFAVRASDLLTERLFLVKIMLIFAGGILAVAFHTGPYRSVSDWDTETTAPRIARACALGSLLGWLIVLALGVLLPYKLNE